MDTGIRTRSKARSQPEQWQYVPVNNKIFSLLADTLAEAKEGGGAAEDDDSWETDSRDGAGSIRSFSNPKDPVSMLRGAGLDQETGSDLYRDAEEVRPREDVDPDIASLDLTQHICNQFRHLAHSDQKLFQECCLTLNPHQLSIVQACFQVLGD